jgi:hypothetical protein
VKTLIVDFCKLIKEFRSEGHNVDVICLSLH